VSRPPLPPATHGKSAAYTQHRKRGERPCIRCQLWASDYKRSRDLLRGVHANVRLPAVAIGELLLLAGEHDRQRTLRAVRPIIGPLTFQTLLTLARTSRGTS
jgi:hypothetical protein